MAAIRFFAFGCCLHHNFLARQQRAAERTFDPGNLPFSCCSGCPGIVPVAAPAQLVLLVAMGLPMHSYPPHVSSLPRLLACFSAAFATAVILSGILD